MGGLVLFGAGDGESGAAPPAADAASRFQGSAPFGGHECGRRTAGATRAQPRSTRKKSPPDWVVIFGAGDEARTRYLDLGKVALYQMSYARKRRIDYNPDFFVCQSCIFNFSSESQ